MSAFSFSIRALDVLRDADAVVRVLDQARGLADAVGHHHRDHVLGQLRGVHAGAEDLVVARGGQRVRPARPDDEGDAVLVEDLDLGLAHGGVVLTGHPHHLVLGDQLLDHRGAGGGTALGILHDQLDLLAEHAAGGVDVVHRPLEPEHQLRTLLVAPRRGQRRQAADPDGVGALDGTGREGQRRGQREPRQQLVVASFDHRLVLRHCLVLRFNGRSPYMKFPPAASLSGRPVKPSPGSHPAAARMIVRIAGRCRISQCFNGTPHVACVHRKSA